MSTGPGPTRKDDESYDTSVEDIAELLVEEESHPVSIQAEKPIDDGLDVMLETPGPVVASTFMPPPPSPAGLVGEEGDNIDEAGAATNLAYEDLLAKLVLPGKMLEPEAATPAPSGPPSSLPMPEAFGGSAASPAYESVLPSVTRPSSPSIDLAPPSEEKTLVTENPLVAEEQEAAAREGRASLTHDQVTASRDHQQYAQTEPIRAFGGAAKSKLVYVLFGGLLAFGGMALAVLVLKLLGAGPAAQPPAVVAPAPVPQPTPAPPAQVQPLPPTPPVAPAPEPTAVPSVAEPTKAKAAPAAEEAPVVAEGSEKPQPRVHRRETRRPAHAAAAKPAPAAPKVAAPKAAAPAVSAPVAKPAKSAKKGKGYADPFD
jgi:hypothetical protein